MTSSRTKRLIEDKFSSGHLVDDGCHEFSEPVLESFPRVAQILRGIVPNVRSVGIITAENPMSTEMTKAENEERNDRLEVCLRSLQRGFHRALGYFGGNFENPFIVPNIDRKTLLWIGNEYDQTSVIYGEAINPAGDRSDGMTFEYWSRDHKGAPFVQTDTQKVFRRVDSKDAKFYTQVKGRKFNIPFFDKKEEDSTWLGGAVIPKDKIPKTPFTESLIEEINRRVDRSFEMCAGSGLYGNLGITKCRIRELRMICEGELPSDKPSVSRGGCFPSDYDPVEAEKNRLRNEALIKEIDARRINNRGKK